MAASNVRLISTTNTILTDEIIRDVIDTFEENFPERVRGYYLLGSYADNTAVGVLSDIDLCILFKHGFPNTQEQTKAQHLAQRWSSSSSVRVDTLVTCELEIPKLHPIHQVVLKLGSLLVFGEDIRSGVEMPTIEAYTQGVVDGAVSFIGKILRNTDMIPLPLKYPDPTGQFYGYNQKRIPSWYPDGVSTGTKELVACVSRIATALVAIQMKTYIASKAESIRLYRTKINDQYADYVGILYNNLTHRWHYLIPDDEADRDFLRQLCSETLAFENHFLKHYHAYLIGLSKADSAEERAFATERLKRLIL